MASVLTRQHKNVDFWTTLHGGRTLGSAYVAPQNGHMLDQRYVGKVLDDWISKA